MAPLELVVTEFISQMNLSSLSQGKVIVSV